MTRGVSTWKKELYWPVTSHAEDIRVGDRVFVWTIKPNGITADAVVAAPVELISGHLGATSFRDANSRDATEPSARVRLRLHQIADHRELLRQEHIQKDPILRDLYNLKAAAEANILVTPEQATRLAKLWSRSGTEWSRNEALAVLWAYTIGHYGPPPRRKEPPIAKAAILTGRWVRDVHANVARFGVLSMKGPSVHRKIESAFDRVLAEFSDRKTGRLQLDRIEQEFSRLWPDPATEMSSLEVKTQHDAVELAARTLENIDINDLLASYHRSRRGASGFPRVTISKGEVYQRCPLVVAISRKRAGHRCEVPGCEHPSFTNLEGKPYCEVHHIVPLAEGGEDTIDNVACVCPAHHREVHLGMRRDEITRALKQVRAGRASKGDLLTGAPDDFTAKI